MPACRRLHLYRFSFVLLYVLVSIAPAAQAASTALQLGSTAINGTGTGVGFADLSVDPFATDGVGFVNVVSDLDRNGNTGGDWVVQNFAVPMHPQAFGGSGGARLSFTFGLGGSSPSGAFTVFASFTAAPIVSPDTSTMTRTNDVPFGINDIDNLVDVPPGFSGGAGSAKVTSGSAIRGEQAAPGPAAEPAGGTGQVRNDIPGILQGKNECGPISAAQSLLWLQKDKGLEGLPDKQADLINLLKGDMKWNPDTGVKDADFFTGKQAFVKRLQQANKPNRVTVEKGGNVNGAGTFRFIKDEINKGEDVELKITRPGEANGHLVTVAGFFDDGKTQKLFFKDPLTGGTTVDSYGLNGTSLDMYKYGNGATISFAVGESVKSVPLPAPGIMIAAGLLVGGVIAAWRRGSGSCAPSCGATPH